MAFDDYPDVAEEAPLSAGQIRRRRRIRRFGASCGFIGAGGLLLEIGRFHWKATLMGYMFIAGGVLGLLGFNIFHGGPLDKKLDPPLEGGQGAGGAPGGGRPG
jgi:hypothetical protein